MASISYTAPPICLQVAVVDYDSTLITNNPVNGNIQLTFGIALLSYQSYGDSRLSYDLTHIQPGMWISGGKSGMAWRVSAIDPAGIQGEDANGNPCLQYLKIYVEDNENYNAILYGNGYYKNIPYDPLQSYVYFVFQLTASGLPNFNGLYTL